MAYMTYGAFISLGAIRASYGNDDYAILGSILGSVFGAIFYAAT